ncbi:ABC transporter ATP-binding protein [Streptacidiphilus carbonis]|uniref:ABC transporter ATP-binding protein n=1 Tax=Streptacidiphilus carbonis TaxID=105422 RepID=UPI000AF836FC|nr:ABC transporter ATP-binding protein [Streptacidiphilus carbonis]
MNDSTLMIRLGDLVEQAPKRRRARISAREAFRSLWPLARVWRPRLVLAALCLLVSSACDVAIVAVFSYVTDHVLTKGDLGLVWMPAAVWLGLAAVEGLATFAGSYTLSWVGENFLRRLRDRTFHHLQQLSPDFFESRPTGDLVERLTSDVDAIEGLVVTTPVTVVTCAANTLFFACAALSVRWDLALLTFAAAPLFWLAARVFSKRIRSASRAERDGNGALTAAIEESLANMTLVQAYNRQDTQGAKVHRESVAWMGAVIRQYRLSYAYGPLSTLVETVCLLSVIVAGAWEITSGRLTLGGLLAFSAYLGYLYPQIQSLGSVQLSLASSTAAAERVLEILETKPSVRDPHPHPQTPAATPTRTRTQEQGQVQMQAQPRPVVPGPRARGVVSFDRVGFTYPGTRRPILDDVSFTAWPGQLVLVAGPSGAGKSTVAKLLLRLYDPSTGIVLLDGQDIARLPLSRLRDTVTLVPQETMVFDASIGENIAYGRPGASFEAIRRAAADADLDAFVSSLPDGYDTPVGQRGRLLSGGQRQRLAIARALVRDTPVLVLDEPTTGLDAESTARVMAPLKRLMADRTTFLITHDARLAAQADAFLSIEHGGLVAPATLGLRSRV